MLELHEVNYELRLNLIYLVIPLILLWKFNLDKKKLMGEKFLIFQVYIFFS
jgi:hypothetical protein